MPVSGWLHVDAQSHTLSRPVHTSQILSCGTRSGTSTTQKRTMKSPLRTNERNGKANKAPGASTRQARAAKTLKALREVLDAAQIRGVRLDASYQHFDRAERGGIDTNDLVTGLQELKLFASGEDWNRDAQDCLELLSCGKSRVYCSRDDFLAFFKLTADDDANSPTKTKSKPGKEKLMASQHVKETAGLLLEIDVDATVRGRAKKNANEPTVTLPEWAHARSKRALNELEKLQRQRSRVGVKQPVSLSPISMSNPSSFDSEDNNNTYTQSGMADAEHENHGQVPHLPRQQVSPQKQSRIELKPALKDTVFTIDQDHAISYRLLTHDIDNPPSIESEESTRLHTALLQVLRENTTQHSGQLDPSLAPFRLTVFMDMFQRLDTLASFFEPLLIHFPRGKILLCGLPVCSQRSTIWNNDYIAGIYGQLLDSLMTKSREWLVQPKLGVGAVPQYLVGFGTGANVALQFLGMTAPLAISRYPSLKIFADALRGLILVNSVVDINGAVRGNISTLRSLLQRPSTDVIPLHEACLSLLFSEHYLTQVASSRRAALEKFFQTRKFFFSGGPSGSCNADVLRLLLRGMAKSTDVRQAAANLSAVPRPFAVLLIHGSQNGLFHPDQIEALLQNLGVSLNAMSVNVGAALNFNYGAGNECIGTSIPYSISWLKSGHEVLQERPNFMYEFFRQLIIVDTGSRLETTPSQSSDVTLSAHTEASSSLLSQDENYLGASKNDNEAVQNTHEASTATDTNDVACQSSCVYLRVQELLVQHGLKWIQQELYDRGLEGSGSSETILQLYQQVLEEEADEERRRQEQQRRQQAKHRQVELLRAEKQRAETERQIREKEVELNIKRKEMAAQRNFFAQMEEEKLAQVRMKQEQDCMALEDALSLKYENYLIDEEDRQHRNESMSKQVEDIEAERGEIDRSKFQVQLQQDRLLAQQKKREALKQFQRAFEQNELVSSPVEAYCLDVSPDYANFLILADGARLVAKDLVHFYELKMLQKEESIQRRAQLSKLREEQEYKLTALRNSERVLIKAKATGMIAKAGLGTVRIVPITPNEMTALARDVDEQRDECERVQHDVTLRSQELEWKDQLLQRLSVLIKRNEGFRMEIIAKLVSSAEKGNEKVLLLREDDEQLMEKLAANRKLQERLEMRLQAITHEQERAQEASTEYFDTRLRIEGTAQRVLRSLLVRELSEEVDQLKSRISELKSAEPQIKRDIKTVRSLLNEAASRTYEVQCALKNLEEAIDSSPSLRNLDREMSGLENPIDVAEDSDDTNMDVPDRVRRKRHVHRSMEEKQWIALDFVLHFARYYKTVDPEEVELIARNVEGAYKTSLTKDQIERLLTLPARNCLAIAFIKSQEELEAHALLRKFTFGDGEDYFAQFDKEFAAVSGTATRPVSITLEHLADTLERQMIGRRDKARSSIPRPLSALLDDTSGSSSVTPIFAAGNCTLDPHKSSTHTFRMPAHSVGVLSLTVSIVFQGHFKPAGYQVGRLAAMLYVIPPDDARVSCVRAPLPIGKCYFSRDIALCTPHSLGRLVIRHEPDVVPLNRDAIYQIVLGAPVRTQYSIDITAKTALFAGEALLRKKSDALKKQEMLPLKRDEIQNVFTTIQLSERKKRLARKMANEAKDVGRAAELELLRATKELEMDNVSPQLNHEQRLALHRTIHDSEARFTESSFRYAKREEEVRDIEQCLRELTRIHVDLLDESEQMEKDLADYRAFLPRIAAALAEDDEDGDVAGAKVAKVLNVEYEPIGARSAKLRWAELSAMKAKLPSMMTPAERLRRKYKKAVEPLEKKEREWVLLDRILHPRMYDWEERLFAAATGSVTQQHQQQPGMNYWRMRLHGPHPTLTKDEEQLATLSKLEVERIMNGPWNLLERKEIQVRKIVTRFRDDYSETPKASAVKSAPPTSMVALLRAQKWSELTAEEREWRQYDRLLNPAYYPTNNMTGFKLGQLAGDLKAIESGGALTSDVAPPPLTTMTREDIVAALNTPDDEVFTLPGDILRARTLLLKYDPQLSTNLLEAARVASGQQRIVDVAETDVDARCRLVYDELQRAIANTRNEFMDSSVLHSTLQRFPTKVLRLELEKDLDRLLISQITEREEYELRTLFFNTKKNGKRVVDSRRKGGDTDSVSESDSDEEAVIAREAREARRLKDGADKNPNTRGRTFKQQSIQKQRRRIRDALQPRSLDERRRLLEEQELGFGGCMACRTNPCSWRGYLIDSTATIQARMETLHDELERVKHSSDVTMSSSVCLAAVQSGRSTVVMRRVDLFDELTSERKRWGTHLRLQKVDAEFHATFQCREPYFETRALHGFPQVQLTDKIQRALQREHNTLVAQLCAGELVEDALEAMLEGWVFGERESQRMALGFVPSLKRDGPLSMHDLQQLEREQKNRLEKEQVDAETIKQRETQGVPRDKWVPIEVAAFERDQERKAVQHGSALDKSLIETERALRFGIFCMTLMYFRGLSLLKRQRATWSQSKTSKPSAVEVSLEKRRMLLEERNVARRQQKAAVFDAKTQRAADRAQKLQMEKAAAYRRRLVSEHQRATREARAAVTIQKIYRGHMGRIAGRRWMVRRREIDAQRALDQAAAITLQRAYRGRLGRLEAEQRREELAEFISQLRAEEAIEEEDAYWKSHRIERAARRVTAFVYKRA